jgi:hypothetical protein
MRNIYLTILAIVFISCESTSYDADRRQLIAKDEIRERLHKATDFDITSFREDTLTNYPDSNFRKPLQYTLEFTYKDSTGAVQNRTGHIIFTPNGKSIITTQITGGNP